jgi:hypothetical protein
VPLVMAAFRFGFHSIFTSTMLLSRLAEYDATT